MKKCEKKKHFFPQFLLFYLKETQMIEKMFILIPKKIKTGLPDVFKLVKLTLPFGLVYVYCMILIMYKVDMSRNVLNQLNLI